MYTVAPSPCQTKLMVSLNGEVQFLVEWDGPSYITEVIMTNVERLAEKANEPNPYTTWVELWVGYNTAGYNIRGFLNANCITCISEDIGEGKLRLAVTQADLDAAKELVEQWWDQEED